SYRGERHLSGPAGAQGGSAGMAAAARIVGPEGVRHLPSKARVAWAAGERLIIETSGGGGWGLATGETA
ncbi:MAG: hydantoinase B/oxoprolinase family protein, partial [Rubritepida sp.]|nr:hydantoinase B/oxoprolinase family protein [Rubritepida sp.]